MPSRIPLLTGSKSASTPVPRIVPRYGKANFSPQLLSASPAAEMQEIPNSCEPASALMRETPSPQRYRCIQTCFPRSAAGPSSLHPASIARVVGHVANPLRSVQTSGFLAAT
jgi:hypothetical protein